jgi:hypothetical protein
MPDDNAPGRRLTMPVAAVIIFQENARQLAAIQYPIDGYPAGVGADLAEWVDSSQHIVINELSVRLIATLHNQANGVRLLPADEVSSWRGYIYRVNSENGFLSISIERAGVVLFNSSGADCLKFIHETA